jgi:hypothetical protein
MSLRGEVVNDKREKKEGVGQAKMSELDGN